MNHLQKRMPLLFVWLVSFLLTVPAYAAPSLSGSTGMIRVPTADSLRLGQFSAGYYYGRDQGTAVAALGLPAGLEVSAAVPWNHGVPDQWNVNAKFNLTPEALLIPALAIGVEDIGDQTRRSFYGVMSKALPFGLRLHVGAGTGRFEGLFGAVEKVLNPTSIRKKTTGFPVTSLIVEMDGYKMNYAARLRLAHGLRLDAGWLGRDERVFLGLSYTN